MARPIRQEIERDEARARLWEWAGVIRWLVNAGAPHANYYSVQPFTNVRVDGEMVYRNVLKDRRLDRAIEVDDFLESIRKHNPRSYEAVRIRYLYREPGGRKKLAQDEQVRLWQKTTGLGRTNYYKRLKAVEKALSLALR